MSDDELLADIVRDTSIGIAVIKQLLIDKKIINQVEWNDMLGRKIDEYMQIERDMRKRLHE